jgi:hypothetical protein
MLFRLRKDMEHAPPESYHRQNQEDVVKRARDLLAKLPEGPWEWNGHAEDVKLTTQGRGRVYIMGVDRAGMQGAQFTFQHFKPWDTPGMKSGMDPRWPPPIYVSRAEHDKKTIVDIDSPLAQLIKMIPEIVETLQQLANPEAEAQRLSQWASMLTYEDIEYHIDTNGRSLVSYGAWAAIAREYTKRGGRR